MEGTLDILRADVEATPDSEARERLALLFDEHHRRLHALAMRLSANADDARDLVQETFLRAARTRRLPPGAAAEAWLVRVLVNLMRDRWRRQRVRRDRAHERPVVLPTASPEPGLVARATVAWALGQLPPRRRAVLVLRELEDIDTSAIARTLGIRRATVRWHLMEGRKQLRRLLQSGVER